MFGVNSWEIVVLALLFVLLFGPDRLPEIASQAGRLLAELRQASESATAELTKELEAATREAKLTEAALRDVGDTMVKGITDVAEGSSAGGSGSVSGTSRTASGGEGAVDSGAARFSRSAADAAAALSATDESPDAIEAGASDADTPTADDADAGSDNDLGEADDPGEADDR